MRQISGDEFVPYDTNRFVINAYSRADIEGRYFAYAEISKRTDEGGFILVHDTGPMACFECEEDAIDYTRLIAIPWCQRNSAE